ncbi:MAG: hypothetical protein ACE5MI_01970 [Acidimicrobiia bacterium]
MSGLRLSRGLLLAAVAVTLIAAIDSALSGNWDVVAVLGLALILQVTVLARLSERRPAIALRADLVRWIESRAGVTGEPMDQIADRAVAVYRAGLLSVEEPDTEGRQP